LRSREESCRDVEIKEKRLGISMVPSLKSLKLVAEEGLEPSTSGL